MSYFFINLTEVSGAQIRQTMKLKSRTIAQTNIASSAPPMLVKIGNKNVPAAAPKRLMVMQVPKDNQEQDQKIKSQQRSQR